MDASKGYRRQPSAKLMNLLQLFEGQQQEQTKPNVAKPLVTTVPKPTKLQASKSFTSFTSEIERKEEKLNSERTLEKMSSAVSQLISSFESHKDKGVTDLPCLMVPQSHSSQTSLGSSRGESRHFEEKSQMTITTTEHQPVAEARAIAMPTLGPDKSSGFEETPEICVKSVKQRFSGVLNNGPEQCLEKELRERERENKKEEEEEEEEREKEKEKEKEKERIDLVAGIVDDIFFQALSNNVDLKTVLLNTLPFELKLDFTKIVNKHQNSDSSIISGSQSPNSLSKTSTDDSWSIYSTPTDETFVKPSSIRFSGIWSSTQSQTPEPSNSNIMKEVSMLCKDHKMSFEVPTVQPFRKNSLQKEEFDGLSVQSAVMRFSESGEQISSIALPQMRVLNDSAKTTPRDSQQNLRSPRCPIPRSPRVYSRSSSSIDCLTPRVLRGSEDPRLLSKSPSEKQQQVISEIEELELDGGMYDRSVKTRKILFEMAAMIEQEFAPSPYTPQHRPPCVPCPEPEEEEEMSRQKVLRKTSTSVEERYRQTSDIESRQSFDFYFSTASEQESTVEGSRMWSTWRRKRRVSCGDGVETLFTKGNNIVFQKEKIECSSMQHIDFFNKYEAVYQQKGERCGSDRENTFDFLNTFCEDKFLKTNSSFCSEDLKLSIMDVTHDQNPNIKRTPDDHEFQISTTNRHLMPEFLILSPTPSYSFFRQSPLNKDPEEDQRILSADGNDYHLINIKKHQELNQEKKNTMESLERHYSANFPVLKYHNSSRQQLSDLFTTRSLIIKTNSASFGEKRDSGQLVVSK